MMIESRDATNASLELKMKSNAVDAITATTCRRVRALVLIVLSMTTSATGAILIIAKIADMDGLC